MSDATAGASNHQQQLQQQQQRGPAAASVPLRGACGAYSGAAVPGRASWHFAEKLGEGAFGEVWRIVHAQTGRFEALKLARCAEGAAWLKREAAVLARLHATLGPTRHVVRLFETRLDAEPAWIALDYVPGASLAERLAPHVVDSPQLGLSQVVSVFRGLCHGMAAAHRVGVVHRDLKPSNILLDFDDTPVICDFGAGLCDDNDNDDNERAPASATEPAVVRAEHASMTPSGLLVTGSVGSLGTHGYASPEQRDSAPPCPADDVYALGVILFQLLLGTTARWPDYPRETLLEEASEPPPESLIALVEACLAHPKRRPADAGALLAWLEPTTESAKAQPTRPRNNNQASTWLVDPHGQTGEPCVTSTVAEAVAQAASGDVIRIRPGHYHEHVELTQPVHLIAERDAGSSSSSSSGVVLHGHSGPCLIVAASQVTLEGLELRSGSGGPALFVADGAQRVRLKRCRLIRLREPLEGRLAEPPHPTEPPADPRRVSHRDAARIGFVAVVEGQRASLTLHACTVAGSLRVVEGKLVLVECDSRVEGEPAIQVGRHGRASVVRSSFTAMSWNRRHSRTAGVEALAPGGQVRLKQGRFHAFAVHARLGGLGTRLTASDCEFTEASHTAVEVQDAAEAYLRRCRICDSRLFHVHVFGGARARLTRCTLTGEANAGVRTGPGGWAIVQECAFPKLTGTPLLREPGSQLHTHDQATANLAYGTPLGVFVMLLRLAPWLVRRGLQAIVVLMLYAALGAVLGFCLAGLPALAFSLHLGFSTGHVLLITTLAGGAVALLGALIAMAVPTLRYLRHHVPLLMRMRHYR